ncbi:MAG TPA: pyridoxamine 5'-phosphate oxidase family protein [Kofleriaceae bacterium]|nr:pyridoxamine 5'-phosphate oxidase family protein [Kofleriaceae bacterium]
MPTSDIAFTPTVKRIQTERGSRAAYARAEEHGGFASEVDDDLAAFLAIIDTAFVATVSADGQPYIQHRGGPRGFIRSIDEHTIGFADFTGNRQYVSTGNLTDNDRVCVMAIDYATRRRVKIWGRARVVPASPELVAALAPVGYRAKIEQVMLISVTAWDVNCPQHIPQKLDAGEVAATIAALRAKIAELEAANRSLQSR